MKAAVALIALLYTGVYAGDALAGEELSERKIAIAVNGVPRSRTAFVQALADSLSTSFREVIRARPAKKSAKTPKAAALRRAAKKLGADYVLSLAESKQRISIRLLDVENPLLTAWSVPALADEEQLVRAGQAIGKRTLSWLSDGGSSASSAIASEGGGGGGGSVLQATASALVAAVPVDASELDARGVVASTDVDDEFALARDEMLEAGDLTRVEAETSAGPLYTGDGLTISTQAKLRAETLMYFTNDARLVGEDKVNRRLAAELTAGAKLKSLYVDAEAGVLVRRDLGDRARDRLEPGELTIALELEPLRVIAGHTRVTWGRATLNSVVDVIDPVDARDFLIREKLPVWMAGAGLSVGPLHADVVFLPFFRADIVDIPLGVAGNGGIASPNRWLNGTFAIATANAVPVRYLFDPGLKDSGLVFAPQLGARLSASMFGVDLALSYANQMDPFPSVRTSVRSSAEQIEVSSAVEYYRRDVFALDGELTAGRFHFIGEAMLARPRAQALENNGGTLPYVAGTVGFDFRSPRFFEDHEVRVFVEATATRALRGELPNDPTDPSVAITRGRFPFPLAIMARGAYAFGEQVSAGMLAVANIGQFFARDSGTAAATAPAKRELDLYLRPEVQLSLFHHVQAVAGVDVLLGGQQQFFGAYKQNSRVTAAIQVDYDY